MFNLNYEINDSHDRSKCLSLCPFCLFVRLLLCFDIVTPKVEPAMFHYLNQNVKLANVSVNRRGLIA